MAEPEFLRRADTGAGGEQRRAADGPEGELAKMMAGQQYSNAIQGAQRGAQGVTGNSQINSFGQFANMMNPDFTPQQRWNIAKAGATNRTSMGGSRSSSR